MKRITFIAPIYNYYPVLIPSLLLQTHSDWRLILIHDGPNSTQLAEQVEHFKDSRIDLYFTDKRYNDYGHSLRGIGLQRVSNTDYLVHTNADNYYVPKFCEYMLKSFLEGIVAVYCDMLHSHKEWGLLEAQPAFGKIDCGAVMFKVTAALETGWKSRRFEADWDMIAEVLRKYGINSFKHVNKPLFVHN